MMAFQKTVRVYDTERGRNLAVGGLRRWGWDVGARGTRQVNGRTLYTLECSKPWLTVDRLLRALSAAKAAFLSVMNGTAEAA
jgi:hypothetical protein